MSKAHIASFSFSGKFFPHFLSAESPSKSRQDFLLPACTSRKIILHPPFHFECTSRIPVLCRSLSFGSFFEVVKTQSTRNRKPEITPHSTPSPHSRATQHELTKVLGFSSIFISRTWRFSCLSCKLRNSFKRIVSSISSGFSGCLQQSHLPISVSHLAERESGLSNPFATLAPQE